MKLTFILILSILLNTLQAQTTTFNKRMLIGCTNNTILTGIQVTDSCYYIMGNAREDSTCIFGSLFSKFDTLGNILSYNITPRSETWFPSFQKTLDDNFVNTPYLFDSIGQRGGVYKYDQQGNILQRIIFDNPLNTGIAIIPSDVIETRDSGYLVLFGAGDTLRLRGDVYIHKYDKQGLLQWSQHRGFNNNLGEYNGYIYHDTTNEIYTIGYQQNNIQYYANRPIIRCMLEQFDRAGNSLWTWESPLFNKEIYGANDLVQTKDKGWVIASALGESRVVNNSYLEYFYDPYVFKLDSARNIVWELSFDNGYSQATEFERVIELEDSSLVVMGGFNKLYPDTTNPSYGNYQCKIVKLDAHGNIIWNRDYGYRTAEFSYHKVYDMKVTPDGGFLIAGEAAIPNQGPRQQGWLLKLDEHGCLVPGCHLVSGVLPPSATSSVELLLYPNPATQFLNVFYQSNEQGQELSFNIINVQGQTVQQYQSAATSGKTYLLEVEQLVAGSYFLEVRLDGKLVKTEKFVVGR